MIDISGWPTTSVGHFFNHFPWQESNSQIESSIAAPLDESEHRNWYGNWPCLSVQNFFSRMVWDGQSSTSPESIIPVLELSYLLNVQDFFSHMMWQGRPQIGMVPKLNLGHSITPDLDLNDLSDLF